MSAFAFVWWKRWYNLGCCLTEHRSSGILCIYHPVKNTINTHVIRCALLRQHRTTTSVLHWARASLINCSEVSDRQKTESSKTKEKRKARVWIDLKHHRNLPEVNQGPSVAHWSFHWQESSQVPSKIYLSVLWCWHNAFLMSEIRLHMDETALILFLASRFLPVLMSIREETRRQADISLRPASHFFKEMQILECEKRPYWKRHFRVFIKLPISFPTFATIHRPRKKAFGLPSQWLWNNRITVNEPIIWHGKAVHSSG